MLKKTSIGGSVPTLQFVCLSVCVRPLLPLCDMNTWRRRHVKTCCHVKTRRCHVKLCHVNLVVASTRTHSVTVSSRVLLLTSPSLSVRLSPSLSVCHGCYELRLWGAATPPPEMGKAILFRQSKFFGQKTAAKIKKFYFLNETHTVFRPMWSVSVPCICFGTVRWAVFRPLSKYSRAKVSQPALPRKIGPYTYVPMVSVCLSVCLFVSSTVSFIVWPTRQMIVIKHTRVSELLPPVSALRCAALRMSASSRVVYFMHTQLRPSVRQCRVDHLTCK